MPNRESTQAAAVERCIAKARKEPGQHDDAGASQARGVTAAPAAVTRAAFIRH